MKILVKVFEEKFPAGIQRNNTAGYYMDGYLKSNLDMAKNAVKDDWDMVIVVDGPEGAGKSVLAQQMAFYCDPTLTLKRIVFREDTFRKAVLDAKRYEAIVFDEAYGGMASRRSMSRTNKVIVDLLTEIRQKNLFIFVVLPSYFDLDKYVALWRSRCLVHIYHDRFQRGYFSFFSYSKKKDLYVYGKKYYNYRCVKSDFKGRYMNFYTVEKEKYKEKNLKSLRAYTNKKKRVSDADRKEIERELLKALARNMYSQQKMPLKQTDIAFMLGISRCTVQNYLKIEPSA